MVVLCRQWYDGGNGMMMVVVYCGGGMMVDGLQPIEHVAM